MFRPLLAVAVLAAPAALATAETRTTGQWILESASGGCIIHAASPNGTVLSIWGSAGDSNLSFLLQNKEWNSFEDGGRYDIQVSFDNQRAWPMKAVARLNLDSDGPGLTFPVSPASTTTGASFLDQFAAAEGMHITRGGVRIDSLSLPDTNVAMNALARCLRDVWSGAPAAGEGVVSGGSAVPVSADARAI